MAPPQIPTPMTPLQIVMRIVAGIAVLTSLMTAFQDPYGLLHWVLLGAAAMLVWAAKRIG